MAEKMIIRKAKKQDLKQISEIFRTEYAKKPYNERWTKKTAYKRIGLYFKDHLMYVAVVENKTAGFLIAIKDCWDKGWYMLVKELVVSSRHQRKGIGKALIDKIEAESRKKGVKKIYLYSHPEAKAAKFYEKMKYKTEPFVCRSKWMK